MMDNALTALYTTLEHCVLTPVERGQHHTILILNPIHHTSKPQGCITVVVLVLKLIRRVTTTHVAYVV